MNFQQRSKAKSRNPQANAAARETSLPAFRALIQKLGEVLNFSKVVSHCIFIKLQIF